MGYVKNRYISESRRLIYDIPETAKNKEINNKKKLFPVTVDTEEAFGWVGNFLLAVLQMYDFGEHFLKWI